MHLRGIDLNLVVVLHALFEERSVSAAARRLGLSQSATSHALARLRDRLGDPLFVRTKSGLAPTARAEALRGALNDAIASLERALLARPAFDAASAEHVFRIATSDYAELVAGPALLARFAESAPGLRVWMTPVPDDTTTALERGEIDLVLAPTPSSERLDGLHTTELWSDHFVGVARRGHPLLRGALTPERFAAARHAFIAPRGRPGGAVDDALEARGLRRRIAFATPSFLVAPQVIAHSDLIITLAARVAYPFAEALPLRLFEPPLTLPGFRIAMYWHPRRHADPAHRFLRAELLRVAKALPAPPKRKR